MFTDKNNQTNLSKSLLIQRLTELILIMKRHKGLLKAPVQKGVIQSLYRERTSSDSIETPSHTVIPKLSLSGDWLSKAGFDIDDHIQIIPMQRMLIVIKTDSE